jgi:uncharacterized protein (DUF983 family)
VVEPESRYILTFKPGSPEMIVFAAAALVGAGFAVFITVISRAFACGEGSSDDCTAGSALLVISGVGVVPVLGMLVESARRRGHPWYWFFAAVIVYALWGVVVLSVWP